MKDEIDEFYVVDNLEDYTDSLLFDEHTIASLKKKNYMVTIEVVGEKRITFKDITYRNDFPEDLIQIIKEGKVYEREDVYIGNNNWFEMSFYEKNEDGEYEYREYFNDILDEDISKMTKEEMRKFLEESLDDYIKNEKEEENEL